MPDPTRIVLDVDPGIDDALAILLALCSPELQVEAITTVAGNLPLEVTTRNALKVVELAGRTDVPVARGARKPLAGKLTLADYVHGEDGLGGAQLPAPVKSIDPRPAAEMIVELVEANPGEITVVAVGPLTNLATALRLTPGVAGKVKAFVLMGGAWSGGNTTPAAEFNIYSDPEAAQVVLESGVPITILTLEATRQAVLQRDDLTALGDMHPAVSKMADHYVAFAEEHGFPGAALHDPLAVGTVIDPSYVAESAAVRMDVELEGRLTRGQTVVNRSLRIYDTIDTGEHLVVKPPRKIDANVTLPVKIDGERFVRLLLERLSAYPRFTSPPRRPAD
jgi:inosine-uridine nucleoside N-ribohydrolase